MPTEFSDRPVGETVQPCPLLKPADAKVHWIEIELIGENDKPIPHEEYAMRLPDGTQIEGYLDANGFARIGNIPAAGGCLVQFPQLDKDAWEPIESTSAKSPERV